VIDIPTLRALIEAGEPRVAIGSSGEILDLEEMPLLGSAVLMVAPVTESVKVVVGRVVHESLDRDTLWSIQGFVLGREVVLALGDDVTTSEDLIAAVSDAGFEWETISPASSST
jgi:hypothetical protein